MLPYVREIGTSQVFEALFARWADDPRTVRLAGGWDLHGTGRFSYLGFDPYLSVAANGDRLLTVTRDGRETREQGDPFALLERLYRDVQSRPCRNDVPFTFQGGAMGFLGYGLRRFAEKTPARVDDDLGLPDLYLHFYDVVAVLDHLEDRAYLLSSGLPHAGAEAERRAKARERECLASLPLPERPAGSARVSGRVDSDAVALALAKCESAFDRQAYMKAVDQAKAYIAAGDVYQVNLAQRFSIPFRGDPIRLFESLRSTNPAPFGAFVRGDGWTVVSVSPERFFYCDGVRVETRPIKGTRPRGATPEDDERLADELRQSGKDQAEHVMIVDLERNDLGRFCRTGTVRVSQLMGLEAHPTVWHLVSVVEGEPTDVGEIVAAVRAAFPGGSITGAPKVRAMEIIDELEPVARGVYTGSIGYFGLGHRIDLNIAIRTALVANGRAYFHVGGGIVADSVPEDEYQETLDKGLGIVRGLAAVASKDGGSERA